MANDKKKMVEAITAQEVDFAQWYTDICTKAELVEYSSVKGFVVLRPYGYAIWENIQKNLDARFKATGHENVAMPVLIPESHVPASHPSHFLYSPFSQNLPVGRRPHHPGRHKSSEWRKTPQGQSDCFRHKYLSSYQVFHSYTISFLYSLIIINRSLIKIHILSIYNQ